MERAMKQNEGAGTIVGRKIDELGARLRSETKRSRNVLSKGVDYLKENPGKSILISLAVGAALATFIRRKAG